VRRSSAVDRQRRWFGSKGLDIAAISGGAKSLGVPELPETETIARDLDRLVRGRTITSVAIRKSDVLRLVTSKGLARRITGCIMVLWWRRAKLIVCDLSTGDRLVIQPRFTGALLIDDGTLAPGLLRHSALHFGLDDGRRLHYSDVRRLGTVSVMDPATFARYEGLLGVEPLDPSFTTERLSGLVRGSRQAVKKLLMDQRRVAGVGNIYANEALWRAGIDPSRAANTLVASEVALLREQLVATLTESIDARGTTFRDFQDTAGQRGGYAERLQAYGRGGLPCRRCGTRLFETHAIDGRSTVICRLCQD